MSILLLVPGSTNGVLPNLTQKLFNQLKALTECQLFDQDAMPLSKAEFFDYVNRLNPSAIFSFNAAGAELELTIPNQGNKNLFSLFPSLHIGWMVDHPVYHIPRLTQINPKRLVLFPTKDAIEFAQTFNLSGTFSSLPFAGTDSTDMGKNHCDRKFDIVIAASFMGYPNDVSQKYTNPINQIVAETIQLIQEKPFLDPYYVLLDRFLDHRLQCEQRDFLIQITKELYDYQRKYNRLSMVESLVNSGLTVGLIGKGWKNHFGQKDRVTYFDHVSHDDIAQLYQDAKVVMNVNAVNGASERLFDAIDSGAMVYSEFSMMLFDMFGSGNGILFHHVNDQESSIELLKDMINNHETEAWAWSAKQTIISAHTWKHRADYIDHIVKAYAG